MSVSYSDIQPQRQTRNGLAVASLVLGIISIPTLGLLGLGAITAIVLGSIALNRIKKEPATHNGKGMAIAGIITSALSLSLIAVMPPLLLQSLKTGRESAAIQNLRIIHNSQALYKAKKGRFGTHKDLIKEGFLDPSYAEDIPTSNYIYTSASEVTQDKYCVQATRQKPSVASRDFNVTEDGIIRFVESKTPRPVACCGTRRWPIRSKGISAAWRRSL